MLKKLIILLCLQSIFCSLSDAQVSQEWVARFNGPANSIDEANSIAVDASGNVYVTGYTYGIGTSFSDYTTIKYNSSGIQQWMATYDSGSDENAYSIAVDGSGNVYMTGASGSDFATIKYNSSGVQQWVARYTNGSASSDIAYSLAVDVTGNVYVTGSSGGSGTGLDYATIKYNSSGIQQWVQRYNGPGNSADLAASLVLDGSGNVYVTGESGGSGTSSDYATIKYNSSGIQQWVARYNGPANYHDAAVSLALDVLGNVCVTGTSYSASASGAIDYATVKYNSSGIQQWVQRYNGPASNEDRAYSLAVDGLNNVYVTGFSNSGTFNDDYATLKYDASGVVQWVQRYDGPGNNEDRAYSIAVDGLGNVYVTGHSRSGNVDGTADYATVKYNSSGTQQWVARYDGPGAGNDWAKSLVLDVLGNVYVTGRDWGNGSIYDYATIKYSQPINCDLNNYLWEKAGNTGVELNSMVYALMPFNGRIIAGGDFTLASGNTVNHIASWNGSIWQSLDNGLSGEVNALTVFQNKLIAGGRFSIAGSTQANNIAQWDGTNWTSFGTGSANGTNGPVLSLAIHNGNLIVGGNFTNAGTVSAKSIAQWDGNNWSAFGSGINGSVNSLLSFNGDLIAGGIFTTTGSGLTVNNIANWDGSIWSSLGTGITLINNNIQGVGALANYNGELIAGGRFNNAGGVPVNFIAKWNGSWSDVGGGFPGSYEGIYSLLVINNFLYAGGLYSTAGTVSANSVAKWDGNVWKALGNGVIGNSGPGIVLSLMSYNNNLYAGGEFISTDYSWITMNPCESTDPIGINYNTNFVPDNYYLYQNYPNPFNPSTNIKFTLPDNSFAMLVVYDALGKEVETLVNEKLSAGSYESNWNASNYPSGIYFYKLTANNFIQTKKMVLLK